MRRRRSSRAPMCIWLVMLVRIPPGPILLLMGGILLDRCAGKVDRFGRGSTMITLVIEGMMGRTRGDSDIVG